jgi:putative ABC transport system permease protein
VPNVFVGLEDAQAIAFGGQAIANSIAVVGTPESLPDGFDLMGRDDARADLLRPVDQARSAIFVLAVLLWLVAATIVGSVIYLSALERIRDFAVFKATGTSTRAIAGDLGVQAVLVAVTAAAVGAVLALLLGPRFPLPVEVPGTALLLLPVLATLVGLVASLAGMRRAVSVDPALAFGGP